jgi:hypothetical protein
MHALACRVERVAAALWIVLGDGGARLHRHGTEALVLRVEPHDAMRLRQRRIDRGAVAIRGLDEEIAARPVPQEWRSRCQRRKRIGHDGEAGIAQLDALGRLLRCRFRLGDDDCHALADVAHALDRERHLQRQIGIGQVRRRKRWLRHVEMVDAVRPVVEAAIAVRDIVAPREDREHAGHRARRCRVDRLDPCVRVARAHERGIGLARQRQIAGEAAAPHEKTFVFDAHDPFADERGHFSLPALSLTSRGRCRC